MSSVYKKVNELVFGKAKDPNDPMNKILPDLVEAVIASCKDDAWPDEVKACISSASGTDPKAADTCIEKMPGSSLWQRQL